MTADEVREQGVALAGEVWEFDFARNKEWVLKGDLGDRMTDGRAVAVGEFGTSLNGSTDAFAQAYGMEFMRLKRAYLEQPETAEAGKLPRWHRFKAVA